MKRVLVFLFIVCLFNTAFQCGSPDPGDVGNANTCGNPEWLTTIISNAEQSGNKGV